MDRRFTIKTFYCWDVQPSVRENEVRRFEELKTKFYLGKIA